MCNQRHRRILVSWPGSEISERGVYMHTEHYREASVIAPGAHVVTPRRGYLHHGIYVGDGHVIHYAGSNWGWSTGPVEEIALDRFRCGHSIWLRCDRPAGFEAGEVIRRARSRVGEDLYRIFTNNCEHFCEWCLRGEHRSYQVEAWFPQASRLLKTTRLVRRSISSQWLDCGKETVDVERF